MSDLRSRVIRLAHNNAKLRPHLLRALSAAGEVDDEPDKEGRFEEGPEGEKQFEEWLSKQPKEVQNDWKENKFKYKDKFKDAASRLFAAAAVKRYAGCEKLPEGPMRDNCEKKKDEKGDKKASLRERTIRLASSHPKGSKLRRELLKALAE